MRRVLVAILALALSLFPLAPAGASTGGFVTASGQQLTVDGQPYRMVGFNLWHANVSFQLPNTGYLLNNGTTLNDTLQAIKADCPSCNVIRAWFFQQEVTPTTAGYNWAPFDKTLQVAEASGFKVIATLADEWSYEGPPQKYYYWYQTGYTSTVRRGTANGVAYNENVPYYQYVHDVVSRYANNPTIAAWELVNEADDARSNGSCPSEAESVMQSFAQNVGDEIRSLDPNHLISLGGAGNGNCGTNEGDYQKLMSIPELDLCSFHDYEGITNATAYNQYNGLNVRVQQCAAVNKPVYIGEAGLHADGSPCNGDLDCRASYLNQKMSAQFAMQGVVGYLPWQYDLRGISGTGDDYVYGPDDPASAAMNTYAS